MKNIVLIMALACLALTAQGQVVTLNLDKCREMALENSRKMSIAAKQQEKAGYDLKSYRANFLPKISGMGMFAYVQKKMSYSLAGGYLPTFVPGLDGSLQPNVVLNPATGQPLTDADGNPVFSSYAYMPDIELDLDLRGAYSVGVMLEQPVYMGGKVRSAYQMAALGKEMAEMNVRYSRAEVLTEADEAYWQYLRVVELVASAEKYEAVVRELVKNLSDAFPQRFAEGAGEAERGGTDGAEGAERQKGCRHEPLQGDWRGFADPPAGERLAGRGDDSRCAGQ